MPNSGVWVLRGRRRGAAVPGRGLGAGGPDRPPLVGERGDLPAARLPRSTRPAPGAADAAGASARRSSTGAGTRSPTRRRAHPRIRHYPGYSVRTRAAFMLRDLRRCGGADADRRSTRGRPPRSAAGRGTMVRELLLALDRAGRRSRVRAARPPALGRPPLSERFRWRLDSRSPTRGGTCARAAARTAAATPSSPRTAT